MYLKGPVINVYIAKKVLIWISLGYGDGDWNTRAAKSAPLSLMFISI